jgi:3',5'-cyclic AMP phosphodiesterase CpdA
MTHRALHLSDLHRGANESPETDGALAELVAELEPVVVIVTGDLANRGRADELRRARALLDALGAPWLAVPGNHDLPYTLPARVTAPGHVFEREIGPREPLFSSPDIVVQGLNSTRPWRHQGGRLPAGAVERAAAAFAAAPRGALRVVALHHHLAGSPWRALRKVPLKHRDAVLDGLSAAGADVVLGGHIHQSTTVRLTDIQAAEGGPGEGLLLATAPGFGRPRPHRKGEAHGVHVLEWDAEHVTTITLSWVVSPVEGGRFSEAGRRAFPR